MREATTVLDEAGESGEVVEDGPNLRARLAVATLRALAMSGHRDEVGDAFEHARRLAAELAP
ncbi:MAG: hypothetical protein R2789_14555 [Microthrixaceae bacterium]